MFSLVFFKVLSALLSVVTGFLVGRFSKVDTNSITTLLFFFIAPIVFFSIPASTRIHIADLGVTLTLFCLSSCLAISVFWFVGKFCQDYRRNILAFSAGTGNTLYIGLPIANSLFDEHTLTIYVLAAIGLSIYESSVGYYFCTKNSSTSAADSVKRIFRLPMLNAFIIGGIFSFLGFNLPNFFNEFVTNMKGAFSVLGMMSVGIALSRVESFEFDLRFSIAALTLKFIIFPIAINILILFDKYVTNIYDANYYDALQLISISPLATNIIIMPLLHNLPSHKSAIAVLISLIVLLVYMPSMCLLML